MASFVDAFRRTFSQLGDPALRRPLLLGTAISGVVFGALWALATWFLFGLDLIRTEWLNHLIAWLGSVAAFALALLLFPAFVAALSALFLEGVVDAVERRFYPGLPAARQLPVLEAAFRAARFLVLSVVLNCLALPSYLVPGLSGVVFATVNGYLIGREYFELVASRRESPQQTRARRRAMGGKIFGSGFVYALLSLVPLVNFLVPVLAVATLTHLFHADLPEPRR